ncbi:hypothetical protein L6205_25050 [Pseudomonas syringae pv. syringae]|uniref:hypothetical protein n=1 Tax=Pseudomonas syringae TaxID=317 RepID=UPI000CDAB7F7|nr:hypothetical protein [Pseudomonas syringae]MCH5532403.1 hypothetical protein [Pseudomonas syringae pv. syringae]MCH5541336.1 hypothetical protein [Pseudomonas syringae pv. syringae]MCH5544054.1 hypothetical protein [Pseudomonas syringae pv. syringae]MCH5604496.1 hypothetical protein [Pseudomonas syringae pv. syringae]MCH5607455.1 hypothetical protein [Pseudomonas syringae pv. syringae]
MTADQELAHTLRMRFGLPPAQPTDAQLANIKAAIKQIKDFGRTATQADLADVVKKYCPGVGEWIYKGADNSDLNTLLALALAEARRD